MSIRLKVCVCAQTYVREDKPGVEDVLVQPRKTDNWDFIYNGTLNALVGVVKFPPLEGVNASLD